MSKSARTTGSTLLDACFCASFAQASFSGVDMSSLAARARSVHSVGFFRLRAGFVVRLALGNNRGSSIPEFSMSSIQKPGLLARAREERESRGLDVAQMGDVLGLTRTAVEAGAVQGYEAGQDVRNGAIVRIYETLRRARQAKQWLGLPKFTVDKSDPVQLIIHHNDYPRFCGVAVRDQQHKEQWRFKKAGMPVFDLKSQLGWRQLIVSYVDHVAEGFDPEDAIEEAIRLIEEMS
jgi:transcriptional regulator with XRE-family HTH domain